MSADVVYLDSSAAVKLLLLEPGATALRRFLSRYRQRVSAVIVHVEVMRAVRRTGVAHAGRSAPRILAGIRPIYIDDQLIARASDLDPPTMRALDAIHVAAALTLGTDLASFVTYDRRMIDAANALGLPVVSPD